VDKNSFRCGLLQIRNVPIAVHYVSKNASTLKLCSSKKQTYTKTEAYKPYV